MKEDLTFFKDDKNKDGSRFKNPKRVFAAKKAHKIHRLSYKQAGDRLMFKDRARDLVEQIKTIFEKIDNMNSINLHSDIVSTNTTLGVAVDIDDTDFSKINITFVTQDISGSGAYQTSIVKNDKAMASTLFQTLTNDLNKLVTTFDNDFKRLLEKHGIQKVVD